MLATKFLSIVTLIAAPLALAAPSTPSKVTRDLEDRSIGIDLDICISVDLNLGSLLGKRHWGDHPKWHDHHPGGTCGDLGKINECYKVGHACNAHCVCVPPPPKVCTDQCAILKCQAQGQATNADCTCKPKCDCEDQFSCWKSGGKLDDECKCVVPSKRWHARDLPSTCAAGLTSCPVSGSAGFECLNTLSTIESCGGCASQGEGQDCSAIEGVDSVTCNSGKCAVETCVKGYEVSSNGTECVKSVAEDLVNKDILVGALKGVEKFWDM